MTQCPERQPDGGTSGTGEASSSQGALPEGAFMSPACQAHPGGKESCSLESWLLSSSPPSSSHAGYFPPLLTRSSRAPRSLSRLVGRWAAEPKLHPPHSNTDSALRTVAAWEREAWVQPGGFTPPGRISSSLLLLSPCLPPHPTPAPLSLSSQCQHLQRGPDAVRGAGGRDRCPGW